MNANLRRVLAAGVLLILGLYAVSSVIGVRNAGKRLQADRQELSELTAMVAEMERVADAPRVAALDIESPDEIVNRIQAALSEAGLQSTVLANQTPGEPQRIGKSDFRMRQVEIKLNAATVQQIADFCDALKDPDTGSVVRDLQLYDPKRSGTRETWNSQLTLTQVIFSPKSDS